MNDKTIFSPEKLYEIFKTSLKNEQIVTSRENSTLEFKEAFGWNSLVKYLKTCAAFANTKGGYIIFGVENKPHRLKGLVGKSLSNFESIDPEKMTNHFNSHFSPEIKWDIHQYEFKEMIFGMLYIYESLNKPVVCCNSVEELKESDIYYRYRGRSERIKYPELRSLLEANRLNEQRMWMEHIKRIARIGVREAGIFDLHTGQVTGAGGAFLIDEALLSQISFIKEGDFSEVKGAPTLKLIGHLEQITKPKIVIGKKAIKIKGIRTADIILAFLNQSDIEEPIEHIKQICFETTAFLPVYYFIHKSNLTTDEIIQAINQICSRSSAKSKLLERLNNTVKDMKIILTTKPTAAAQAKRKFIKHLLDNKVDQKIKAKELSFCLQAIRCLSVNQVKDNFVYISKLLKEWFNYHYASGEGSLVNDLRRAICWLDEAMYKEKD